MHRRKSFQKPVRALLRVAYRVLKRRLRVWFRALGIMFRPLTLDFRIANLFVDGLTAFASVCLLNSTFQSGRQLNDFATTMFLL